MAHHKLEQHAIEEGTFPIEVTFLDSNDQPFVPNDDIEWTLTDADKNVVAIYENVAFNGALGSSIVIVLSGEELQMLTEDEEETRYLTVQCSYDSTYGSGLPFIDVVEFVIDGQPRIIP